MRKGSKSFNDQLSLFYGDSASKVINATIQVTDSCNLACTYCYQINKKKHIMDSETGKEFIDMLLLGTKGVKEYLGQIDGLILEFIGGEPFLAIDLIEELTDYLIDKMIELNHPFLDKYRISICSNGVLYFDPKVQAYIKKHFNHLSFNISIDGNKELHDACRIFPDGSGSYDIAIAGVKHYTDSLGGIMGSKMTLAPQNIDKTFEAVKNLIGLGYKEINLNCVFEEGWTAEHAKILYNQLKWLSDYMIDNGLTEDVYVSMFEQRFFRPMSPEQNNNWCFPKGTYILTPYGEKDIADLNINDLVVTKDFIEKISNIYTHEEKVFKLKATGMYETLVTAEHPYWAKKKIGINQYSNAQWIPVKNLSKSDKIALKKMPFGDKSVNKAVAYIAGRYVGDGWYSTTGYKICCAHDEKDELEEALKKAKIIYSHSLYPTVEQFNISARNKELIDIISSCGVSADTKCLPKDIFNWTIDSAKAFLDGYLSADGYYSEKKKMFRCNTVSHELAQELLDLIRSLGYFPMCSIDYREGESKIEGRTVHIKNRYNIEFRPDKYSKFCSYDQIEDCVWTTISDIQQTEEIETVYDLTIEVDHSFIANGAIVHNCGGTGKMIAVDYKGDIYPCLRYMESSLGDDIKPPIIGNLKDGIMVTDEQKHCVECLKAITRRSQSTDECFYCPIAEGCAWCSAYNYQCFGTADKRATYICIMHKARALANAYYWNKKFRKEHSNKRMKLWIPENWALEIIDQDEWDMLKQMEGAE